MRLRSQEVQVKLDKQERKVLKDLRVAEHLTAATATSAGMAAFAEAFHYCRVGFVRANFILGSRCPDDER